MAPETWYLSWSTVMPSPHMVRYVVDLYPDQAEELEKILREENLKRSRFLRECVNYVLTGHCAIQDVIITAKQKSYVKVKR